jgi:hypothetical protein
MRILALILTTTISMFAQGFVPASPEVAAQMWRTVSGIPAPTVSRSMPMASSHAAAAVEVDPSTLPSVPGLAIQIGQSTETGSISQATVLIRNPSGTYLIRGLGNGHEYFLGARSWSMVGQPQITPGGPALPPAQVPFGVIRVVGADLSQVLPNVIIDTIEVFRQDGGTLQRTCTFAHPGAPNDQSGPYYAAISEGVGNGVYVLTFNGLKGGVVDESTSVCISGPQACASRFVYDPAGNGTAWFDPGISPAPGYGQVTICAKGACGTAIMRRRVQVNSGKG